MNYSKRKKFHTVCLIHIVCLILPFNRATPSLPKAQEGLNLALIASGLLRYYRYETNFPIEISNLIETSTNDRKFPVVFL